MEWMLVIFLIGLLIGLFSGIYVADKLLQEDEARRAAINRIDTANLDKEEGWKD